MALEKKELKKVKGDAIKKKLRGFIKIRAGRCEKRKGKINFEQIRQDF